MTSLRDDVVHAWTGDPTWQESIMAWFLDLAQGVGGVVRWGIHPHLGFGRFNLFVFKENEVRFRRHNEHVPFGKAKPEAEGPLCAGSCIADIVDGRVRFAWNEPECAVNLEFHEHFGPVGFDGRPQDDAAMKAGYMYAGHIENCGDARGTVRLGKSEYRINALCHRDRSWGPRDMSILRTNRMFAGSLGKDFAFAMHVLQMTDGQVHKVGNIVRNGVRQTFDDFIILPTVHLDGYSIESTVCKVRMSDGEELVFHGQTIAGELHPYDGYYGSEHIQRVRLGNREGFANNEFGNNPHRGTEYPKYLIYVDGGDGLSAWPKKIW